MSHNRGVVTIQAGMYANFVGAHWWNMQEASFCYNKDQATLLDIDHDVLFREGLNYRRETTFTPRLLCIDLKENLTGMRGRDLYLEPSEMEIPDRLKNTNNEAGVSSGLSGSRERSINSMQSGECYSETGHSSLWDGRLEVKALHSNDDLAESPGCSTDQIFQDYGQRSSSIPVEIYDPEKVNVFIHTPPARCPTQTCWGNKKYNDMPKPKPELAPQSWCKILNTGLHPKSPCFIDECSLNDSSPLDVYGSGVQAFSQESRDDIEDKLRWYVEEIDYLQGFQFLLDSYNGFGGVADSILQFLNDEYQKKRFLCFPVFQNSYPLHTQDTVKKMYKLRLYSTLLSFSSLYSHSSIFSPLTLNRDLLSYETPYTYLPYVHLNPQLLYHSSAILAGALESITTPYRLKSGQFQMSDIERATAHFDRKLLSTTMCFPFPLRLCGPNYDMILYSASPEFAPCSLTPFHVPSRSGILSLFAVIRGVPENKLTSGLTSSGQASAEDFLNSYVHRYVSRSAIQSGCVCDEKVKLTPPFPNFFCLYLNSNGYLWNLDRPYNSGVKSIPVASFLSNSSSASHLLGNLFDQAEKLKLKSYAKHEDPFVEGDDFNEAVHNLQHLKDSYGDPDAVDFLDLMYPLPSFIPSGRW